MDGQTDDGQTVITIAHPEHSSAQLKIVNPTIGKIQLTDSFDMPVYKTTVQQICTRCIWRNWHVSTEAQSILIKFQVYKILSIGIIDCVGV